MSINIHNISKKFHDFQVLKNITLNISQGELIALLGPSGSGKTTLLRIIAGLDNPTEGKVTIFNEEINNLDPSKRKVGFVFQHYALFKHMTVYENIAFGLKMQQKLNKLSNTQIHEKVQSLLKLIHLESLKDRYPKNLSGGQKQRVALARSLAVEPKILLLDEPFGALDLKVRKELRRWLRNIHEKLGITIIFVTHDQEEAMEVADRVVIMSQGKIEQVGPPSNVYQNPINSFVYDFLGNFNVFLGWKNDKDEISILDYQSIENYTKKSGWFKKKTFASKILKIFKKNIITNNNEVLHDKGSYVEIFVRPHDIEIHTKPLENKDYITAKISHINEAGPLVKIELERDNQNIIYAEITHSEYEKIKPALNREIFVHIKEFTVYE